MEELTIETSWGNKIKGQIDFDEVNIAIDRTACSITKEQARTLGEWLIKSSEEQ